MLLQRCFEVSQAPDLESFRNELVKIAAEMGFGLVTGALVVENPLERGQAGYHLVSNMPKAFKDSAADPRLVQRDPVVRRMKELSVPFFYDQELYVREGAGELWEEQASYGYKSGIAVALHLPEHRHFLLGVDRDLPLPRDFEHLARLMAELQFLAVHAQAGATRLLLPASPAADLPKLAEREKEILRWTQEGKSNWAIGQILGLSEEGVRYHLRSICKKLDATSKHHALVKALQLGLL